MPTPHVTVVIPYYAAAAWVEEALRSVLEQDYPAVDVVLVNDGSPDTPLLEATLARVAQHPRAARLSVIHQENAGPSAARNHGVRVARGEYVGFLDADDRWSPTLVSRAVATLGAAQPADVVFFDGFTTAGDGRRWRISDRSPTVATPGLADVIGGTSTVITSGTVVRREAFLAAGGFDESLRRSEDFDFWLRMLRRGAPFRAVPEPLVHRRLMPDGLSADKHEMRRALRTVLARQLADPTLPRQARRAARRHDAAIAQREQIARAEHLLLARMPAEARQALGRAFRHRPTVKLLASVMALWLAPTAFTRWFGKRSASQVSSRAA